MAYRLSIGVNIDASGAKSGSAEAKQAVATISTEADRAAPKVDNVADAVERVSNAGKSSSVPATIGAIGDAADRTRTKIQQLINASVRIHDGAANENARRWSGVLADEATSIDSLRAKYNPLFATIQHYKQVQMEIRAAHAMGALSADEFTAAMSRERQAALASIDAIKGRNAAVQSSALAGSTNGWQTSNIVAQFQDIGVTAAMGMSPLQIALQQGTQLSSVIQGMGSGRSIISGLAAAFTSLVSPVSLVTIGLVGGGAAALQYFSTVISGGDESAAKLKEQSQLVQDVAQRWGDAIPALRDYANEIARTRAAMEVKEGISILNEKTLADVKKQTEDARASIAAMVQDLRAAGEEDDVIKALQSSFKDFATAAETGKLKTEDVDRVQKALAAAINSTGIPALSEFAKFFDVLSASALSAAGNVQGVTTAAARAQDITTWRSYNADSGRLETNGAPWSDNIQNPGFATPELGPAPTSRPRIELEGLPGQMKAAGAAAKSAAIAYRDLVKSADDRVAQMKLEAQLAGETGVAAEALRFKLDLLQQSEDKGRSLTPKQVEAINARVDAFKKYAEEAAKATLKADLLFEREQLGRSAFDQQIASSLRGAGLEVDFDSYEAGLIRTNLQLQYARDLTGDFVGTLFDGIQQGKGLWESLGDAAVNSLKRISETLLNDVLNSLFKVNSASAGGGSGGGLLGLLGNLFGFGSGSGASASSSSWSFGLDDWQFAGGGYTGPGGIHEPRGVVHAGEIVFSQRDVARNGGVAAVEAMRLGYRGYDNGGVVGVTPLMSPSMANRQSASAADRGMGTLKLLLGIAADGNGNIMPVIQQAIDKTVPGYIQMGIEDYDGRMPERVAAINAEPWRR